MESVFLQEVKSDGIVIPLSPLISATYIEGICLNAPKLILKFADHDNDITDSFGVGVGSQLDVVLGDVGLEEGDNFTEQFTVISPPKKVGDQLLVEALQKDVYELKQYLNKPLFFVDKSPAQILSKLAPSKKAVVTGVNGRGTFHITNDVTPSQMLEQMAAELGAKIYYCRGKFYVTAHTEASRQAVGLKFEYNNPNAERTIFAINTPFSNNLIKRNKVKDYQLWDENLGVVSSGVDTKKQSIPNLGQDRLNALNSLVIPVMNSQYIGNTKVMPMMKLGFTFHRFDTDRIINESLPAEQLVIEVRHHQQGYQFVCQMTTGVLSE